jgi:putative endonuclease
MPFSAYILQSEVDKSLYVGHTANMEERLFRHNQGRSKYTKAKRPWLMVHCELFDTRALAMQRERALKSLHRKDLLLKIIAPPQ